MVYHLHNCRLRLAYHMRIVGIRVFVQFKYASKEIIIYTVPIIQINSETSQNVHSTPVFDRHPFTQQALEKVYYVLKNRIQLEGICFG